MLGAGFSIFQCSKHANLRILCGNSALFRSNIADFPNVKTLPITIPDFNPCLEASPWFYPYQTAAFRYIRYVLCIKYV